MLKLSTTAAGNCVFKNYWSERKALLSKIRNPLAHHRDEVLYNWELRTAEAYCQEVLAVIEKARTSVRDIVSPAVPGAAI